MTATVAGSAVSVPVCPGFAKCVCNSSLLSVTGALNTGEGFVLSVDSPTLGSAHNPTLLYLTSAGDYCGGGDQTVTLTSFSTAAGATAAGTFSGTAAFCAGPGPDGGSIALTGGNFSCHCNE